MAGDLHDQLRDLWQTLTHIHHHSSADPDMEEVHRLATAALRDVDKIMDAVFKVANAIIGQIGPELPNANQTGPELKDPNAKLTVYELVEDPNETVPELEDFAAMQPKSKRDLN
jgi:hypothetical protein